VRGVAALSRLIAEHVEGDGTVVLVTHQEVPIAASRQQRVELVGTGASIVAEDSAC